MSLQTQLGSLKGFYIAYRMLIAKGDSLVNIIDSGLTRDKKGKMQVFFSTLIATKATIASTLRESQDLVS